MISVDRTEKVCCSCQAHSCIYYAVLSVFFH